MDTKSFLNKKASKAEIQNQLRKMGIGNEFGISIEGQNADCHELAWALTLAGLAVEVNGFSFGTQNCWKMDASLGNTFRLVSPKLESGIEGLATVCRIFLEKGVLINRISLK